MNETVINGLVKRRAALAGEIEAMHETIRKMVADLEALDSTIAQFHPDFKVETIKMPNESAALTLAQGDDDATLELLPASCAKFHELGSILAQILARFSVLTL
jgi:hypothetical protein